MAITGFLAVVAVSDQSAAEAWYTKLLGAPASSHTMEGLVEWYLPSGNGLQVVTNPERAGQGMLTVTVEGIASVIATARGRGLEIPDATSGEMAAVTTIADPDGNQITLADAALATT